MLLDIKALQYSVLPAKAYGTEPYYPIWERTYEAWKEVWSAVYREIRHDNELTSDAFLRSDFVANISYQNEIVAVHLYSFYELSKAPYREHSFLKHSFSPDFIAAMQAKGRTRVMSLEQLTVTENWRKHPSGFSFANVLIALGLEYYLQTGCHATIASTRNSRKVNQRATRLGLQTLCRDVIVNGEPSDLMFFDQPKRPPIEDPRTEELVARLWSDRTEYVALRRFDSGPEKRKEAA